MSIKRRVRTLRGRLVWTICLSVITLAIIGGAISYEMFRRSLSHEMDHALTDKLRFFKGACVQEERGVKLVMPAAVWDGINDPDDPEYFHYRYQSGKTVLLSRSMRGDPLPEIGRGSAEPQFSDLTLPGGLHGRCAGVSFYPPHQRGSDDPKLVHLVVAHPREHVDHSLSEFLLISSWLVGAATVILLLAAAWVVRRSLRPLTSLTKQIDEIGVGDTTARFDLPSAPAELEPVVARMNRLMDRVQSALVQEREFTSDAAHELRNPVAAIRTQSELALRRPRTAAEYEETIRSVLGVNAHLASLLDSLLLLARLDAGGEAFAAEKVDIVRAIKTCWRDFESTAEAKGIDCSLHLSESRLPSPTTSPDLLAIALRNFFDNAVEYTPRGGSIEISADAVKGRVQIAVANTAPGLEQAKLDKLFRRFRRADPSHGDEPGHAGIGLSLCAKIAEILGGKISANADDGRVRFEMSLPVDDPHREREIFAPDSD